MKKIICMILAIFLLASLAGIWVLIGIYVAYQGYRKKKLSKF